MELAPDSSGAGASSSRAGPVETSSGLLINLHPLPILNISEHHTRARLSSGSSQKVLGALLGTQTGREVSITNSFELVYTAQDLDGAQGQYALSNEFLDTRRDQFKQVFPTLDVVGWYTVGQEPTTDDSDLHRQISALVDTCVFLLFQPDIPSGSQNLPIQTYESSLVEDTSGQAFFVQLPYNVETGEAERIAVDGATRGNSDESLVVGHLITQRNAIKMLYDKINVLLRYVAAVVDGTAPPDHQILRQIAALVASLPAADAPDFRAELQAEQEDVQLTSVLTELTRQVDALSGYADKHNTVFTNFPSSIDEFGASLAWQRSNNDFGRRRRG